MLSAPKQENRLLQGKTEGSQQKSTLRICDFLNVLGISYPNVDLNKEYSVRIW